MPKYVNLINKCIKNQFLLLLKKCHHGYKNKLILKKKYLEFNREF